MQFTTFDLFSVFGIALRWSWNCTNIYSPFFPAYHFCLQIKSSVQFHTRSMYDLSDFKKGSKSINYLDRHVSPKTKLAQQARDQTFKVSCIVWVVLVIKSFSFCLIGTNITSTSTMKNYNLLIFLFYHNLNKKMWLPTCPYWCWMRNVCIWKWVLPTSSSYPRYASIASYGGSRSP